MLTPSQNERLQDLFARAAEIAAEDRRRFLVEQCAGDEVLLAELMSLLDVERAGLGSFLGHPIVEAPAFDDADADGADAPYDSDGFMMPKPTAATSAGDGNGDSTLQSEALQQLTRKKRYRLAGEISRGGMGVVLRGQDNEFERPVAIKVMRRELLRSPYLVHRFVEEAQINGRLQHPGIVPVYDMGLRTDELPYFSMKLIEGKTLNELLRQRPDPIELLGIFEQVCHAVAYAHSRSVVHRDLKPANVMVGEFGEVHVLDWGVAKITDAERDSLARDDAGVDAAPGAADRPQSTMFRTRAARRHEELQSRFGTVIGTLPYMPPEQARGDLDIGPTADVFAIGAMLCQLLTGRPAYEGETDEMYDLARRGDLTSAQAALADCGADPELIDLTSACLQADPAARPQDASVVAVRIRGYLRSTEERRRKAEIEAAEARVMVAQERRARRLTLALAAVVAMVLSGAGATYAWWNGLRRERAAAVTATVEAGIEDSARALGEHRFEETVWQVDSVRAALRSDDATAALRDRVEPRLADLELQARLALDNARLLAELEDIRMPERGSPGAPDYRRTDWVAVDAAYRAVFVGADMDPDADGIEAAAARIAARNAPTSWAPILDEWSVLRVRAGNQAGSDRLLAIADLVDRDPNRTRLRHALRNTDVTTLVRHATSDSLATDSASTLNLLSLALQQGGERQLAIKVLRDGSRLHGSSFAIHMNLARALLSQDQNNADEACRHYLAASILRPANLEARHELARALHMFLGENERAQDILIEMLAAEPDDAHLLYHLGYVQIELGRHDDAIATLRRAIELAPDDAANYTSLGSIFMAQKRLPQAIEAYRTAARLDPQQGMVFANLGIALQRAGQFDEAITVLQHALELDPEAGDAHSTLGIIAMAQQRYDDAVAHFRQAIAIDDEIPEYHTNLGYALAYQNQAEAALAAYDAALRLDRDFAPAHFNRGTLNITLGNTAAAERALWECIRSNPGYLDAYNALGATFWDKDWEKVATVYRRGVEANPTRIDFFEYLAEAHRQLGRHREAVAAYRQMIALDAGHSGAHESIGNELMILGRYREALAAFESARRYRNGAAPELDERIEAARRAVERSLPLEPLIAGEATSEDRTQLLAAAQLAHARAQYRACVRLYEAALAAPGGSLDARGPEQVLAIEAAA
ncbi:MAG: tetratricopeptide repeat protein, partial [Planctomycetes bacterium]|nr:tetratricopeptide repeat protein [Planctomycetota bacterium]